MDGSIKASWAAAIEEAAELKEVNRCCFISNMSADDCHLHVHELETDDKPRLH